MNLGPAGSSEGASGHDGCWDVVVVGAGPAGAIAACSLARRGVSVLLLERERFPRWKVCGACLSPGALSALESVGLGGTVDELGAKSLDRLSLAAWRRRAAIPLHGSVALSRPVLDRALVRAATSAGAVFRDRRLATLGEVDHECRLVHVEGAAEVHAAAVVLDATGLGGRLRPRVRIRDGDGRPHTSVTSMGSRVGVGATFDHPGYELREGELRMVVGTVGYAGLVRVEGGQLNVGAAVNPVALREGGPEGAVAAILAECGEPPLPSDPVRGWRGTPRLTQRRTDVGAERLLRLGDAVGYVEPFTGEGMCWALHSGLVAAELAFQSLDGWTPRIVDEWRAYHANALSRAQRLCRAMAWALRRPKLVRGVVGLLGVAPLAAEPFVRAAAARPRNLPARAA